MLENIALIASLISALTAITTSLRALGKSHENSRYELEYAAKAGCRIADYKANQSTAHQRSLLLYLVVTVIWFVLSVIFAAPFFIRNWSNRIDITLILSILPFLLLIIVLWLIWLKIMHPKR